MDTINQELDFDTAYLISSEFGVTAKKKETVPRNSRILKVGIFMGMSLSYILGINQCRQMFPAISAGTPYGSPLYFL